MAKVFVFEFATVEKIIDADTVKITCDTGFGNTHSDTFRLAGLNAPEIDTPEGKAAKAFVEGMIPQGAKVSVKCHGKDKYGRWLATITTVINARAVSVNADLILAGHAVPMRG